MTERCDDKNGCTDVTVDNTSEKGKDTIISPTEDTHTEIDKNGCTGDGKTSCTEAEKSNCVEDGKNKCAVRCRDCRSLVLSERAATYLQESHPLPTPTQPRHAPSPTTHDVSEWWTVEDMFTFDNIGFSHTVGSVKYLVCADCEHGPLGWHDTVTRRSYVALQRVNNGS
ncbi:hypothetical protein Pmani_028348 [Petrolisthes manimaculis]|uniref:Guanine nucleotide exchange factor MSS4 n=1 Tax=Petrolisthes manimaculis TaxID=1843537 RepID=A0AAE1TUY3_9EUCA|nr:hypothetical protein Pmani_028348 [Petrolisthes manimaculis]